MELHIVPAYDRAGEIRELFGEYTALLIAGDPDFADYLKLQHYDRELSDLTLKYGLPRGRLYIACCDGVPAGCIAMRELDAERCEMKRLYVRPAYRGQRVGSRLVAQVIADAREIGYRHLLLDTFPFLESAIRMYRGLGFYEIEKYNNSPMPSTLYMQLDL